MGVTLQKVHIEKCTKWESGRTIARWLRASKIEKNEKSEKAKSIQASKDTSSANHDGCVGDGWLERSQKPGTSPRRKYILTSITSREIHIDEHQLAADRLQFYLLPWQPWEPGEPTQRLPTLIDDYLYSVIHGSLGSQC
jgi:hypothetical protein